MSLINLLLKVGYVGLVIDPPFPFLLYDGCRCVIDKSPVAQFGLGFFEVRIFTRQLLVQTGEFLLHINQALEWNH